jgi:hypothetical protein
LLITGCQLPFVATLSVAGSASRLAIGWLIADRLIG